MQGRNVANAWRSSFDGFEMIFYFIFLSFFQQRAMVQPCMHTHICWRDMPGVDMIGSLGEFWDSKKYRRPLKTIHHSDHQREISVCVCVCVCARACVCVKKEEWIISITSTRILTFLGVRSGFFPPFGTKAPDSVSSLVKLLCPTLHFSSLCKYFTCFLSSWPFSFHPLFFFSFFFSLVFWASPGLTPHLCHYD